LSASDLAKRINGLANEAGDPTEVSQQVVSKFEQGKNKRFPAWTRFVIDSLVNADGETREDPHLTSALSDDSVGIALLPTFAGMGGGGTGDDDQGVVSFSRDLIERELRAPPSSLLAMIAEGNSMEPDFRGGDQILVDTRRKSLAQPGAFCLWDGDGHVIKYLEKVPDSDPAKVRVVSANGIYEPRERLLEEIHLIGRVIWFGRRVH
jgi:phage repressor protein C with HTH and peptisase S24 domain